MRLFGNTDHNLYPRPQPGAGGGAAVGQRHRDAAGDAARDAQAARAGAQLPVCAAVIETRLSYYMYSAI